MALGFDAVAQPCDMRAEMQAASVSHDMSDMKCHTAMMSDTDAEVPTEMPARTHDTCCCAALLAPALRVEGVDLSQPVPSALAWADPLPDNAKSIMFEYEPPPPRA